MTDFEINKEKAIKNVASLDRLEGYKDRHLSTIYYALEAGLKDPTTNAHFDALVMLDDLIEAEAAYDKLIEDLERKSALGEIE